MWRSWLFALMVGVLRGEVPISCTREGNWALTFDGGPSHYTGQLLGILAKHNVKATFHITPTYLDNPVIQAYLKRAAADGHLIGLKINDPKNIQKEIDNGREALTKYVNRPLKFVRMPMPLPADNVIKSMQQAGLQVTSFNFDSLDYLAVNRTINEAGDRCSGHSKTS